MARASVPPVMSTLKEVNNPRIKVKMIALSRTKDDGVGLAESLKVRRVPTFVVTRNGKEVARFIEFSRTDFFIDDILTVL